ncbi:MAG: hypothetical protein V1839_02755 [archaeon]
MKPKVDWRERRREAEHRREVLARACEREKEFHRHKVSDKTEFAVKMLLSLGRKLGYDFGASYISPCGDDAGYSDCIKDALREDLQSNRRLGYKKLLEFMDGRVVVRIYGKKRGKK